MNRTRIWTQRTPLEFGLLGALLVVSAVLVLLLTKAPSDSGVFSGPIADFELQQELDTLFAGASLDYETTLEGLYRMSAADRAAARRLVASQPELKARIDRALAAPRGPASAATARRIRRNGSEVILNFDAGGRLAATSLTDGDFHFVANVSQGALVSYSVGATDFTAVANLSPGGQVVSALFDTPEGHFVSREPGLSFVRSDKSQP